MYGTLSDADAYFANDLSGTWDNYSDAQKTKALEQATTMIDRLQFKGEKYQYSPDQTLQFPRIFRTVNRDIYFDDDLENGGVVVPTAVKQAAYTQAKYLLDLHVGGSTVGQAIMAGITSISVGSTSESYDKTLAVVDPKTGVHRDALHLLEEYLLRAW